MKLDLFMQKLSLSYAPKTENFTIIFDGGHYARSGGNNYLDHGYLQSSLVKDFFYAHPEQNLVVFQQISDFLLKNEKFKHKLKSMESMENIIPGLFGYLHSEMMSLFELGYFE